MSQINQDKAKLQKLVRSYRQNLLADNQAKSRVRAVNTLLNSGYNLKVLDDKDLEEIWESLFFALWQAEMGKGCEEIITAIERACSDSYRLTRIGFKTISKKWYGLDQYRIDKVSHLARHLLPALINHQIGLWFQTCKRSRKLGTRNIYCKQLLKNTFNDVAKSYGLCYFLLEILADELTKSLSVVYDRLNITRGKFELKANLIVFLYQQVISFARDSTLDARLLRTFDQYVIKKFMEQILPNESQLTQILISLRLFQALDKSKKKEPSSKCKALFGRWSSIVKDIHENCLNGEYFPLSVIPVETTMAH